MVLLLTTLFWFRSVGFSFEFKSRQNEEVVEVNFFKSTGQISSYTGYYLQCMNRLLLTVSASSLYRYGVREHKVRYLLFRKWNLFKSILIQNQLSIRSLWSSPYGLDFFRIIFYIPNNLYLHEDYDFISRWNWMFLSE